MKNLSPKYDHKAVEEGKYDFWLKGGFFEAGDTSKQPFTIVIPPPNVTGKLHLGHAWDTSIQDMIIRRKRMQGYDALWIPGMDHAGIATQAKVDKRLKDQGISRYDIGREKFLDQAWAWKEEYASIIRKQWAALGLSLDYTKERFTLDEGLNKAVNYVFISLYNKGYIYQGERIINWDCQAKTALSNIEVIHQDDEGAFYYFKYPFVDASGYVMIATTRPETMFADQAIMVNPKDERFKDIVGKEVYIPGTEIKIPVITDEYVDMEFGTGCVKCTPAHDPNDYEVGRRHNLAMPLCMNDDGTMNEMAGKYQGMDRFACREALINDLKESGLFDHLEKIVHSVGHSERTGVVVEPRLSKQWFVKMDVLARQVLENKEYEFVPERFNGTLKNWLTNIQDWCISRQLWWGHRIPAWYKNGETKVCEKCPGEGWTQDEDVLDTWFSSALWPFSTMGWPENTEMLKRYYPTDVLVTGYDIIFFWVSRMLFEGIEFTGHAPFKQILIHGLIRDPQGRKMSKSLGNGIDPLDIVDKYSTDALRFSLLYGTSVGNDIKYMPEKLDQASNFANKLWNASKFVINSLEDDIKEEKDLRVEDRWILNKLNNLIKTVSQNINDYDLGVALENIYNFIWNEFCDWYIEMAKSRLYSENKQEKAQVCYVLNYVLRNSLKLLHPFMPFITSEIYAKLVNPDNRDLMVSDWPKANDSIEYDTSKDFIENLKDVITQIRNVRANMNVHPSKKTKLIFVTAEYQNEIEQSKAFIEKLGFANEITIQNNKDNIPQNAISIISNGMEVYIPFEELVDVEEEKKRLEDEKKKVLAEIERASKMLANPGFVNKAPEAKINEEKAKLNKYQEMLKSIEERIK